jgi:hypothetical protein
MRKELWTRSSGLRDGVGGRDSSGFCPARSMNQRLDEGVSFLKKLFTLAALGAKVREFLDAPGSSASSASTK